MPVRPLALLCLALTLSAAEPGPGPTNTAMRTLVEAWCQAHGSRLDETAGTTATIAFVGRTPRGYDARLMAQRADEALDALEQWSGGNSDFQRDDWPDEQRIWMVIFPDNGSFDRFLAWARQRHPELRHDGAGDDLVASLRTLGDTRVRIGSAQRITPQLSERYAIYIASQLAMGHLAKRFSAEAFPSWLTEGLHAMLQRQLPAGQSMVQWKTIAYENRGPEGSVDWAGDLRRAIAERDRAILRIGDLTGVDLVSCPYARYLQMWSLTRMLVLGGGGRRGEQNQFHRLLHELLAGRNSNAAIEAVYGLSEPQLSQRWAAFAQQDRG